MITLRYHIVSITAVFLALAVGVVLGSTAISGRLLSGLSGEKNTLAQRVSDLENHRNALNAKLGEADEFAAAVGPLAVKDRLTDRTVVIVTTEDARPSDRDAVSGLLKAAGATVTGEVQLTAAFADPSRGDQLRDLVARLQPAGSQLPTAADPGTRAGGLFGTLLLLNPSNNEQQATPEEAAAALAGLSNAGFVKATSGVKPAQLAIVLTGGAAEGDSAADRASTIARFSTQLDRSGAGVVLAGGDGSANGTGAIGVIRADTNATSVLSTVDNADTPAGQAVVVMALREQLEGRSGRYGVAGNAEASAPGAAS
ncbi:Copper transport outer membrane protein, MctB [Lentzea fradiae]|uniref:Copper transport outer membrane protein, MctB n=1 Tax=Lentzea fradiae TaxID=200378 RepID=A0A1G7U5T7_9PSEU|nr:copper transporter [Lentzea fradiae]SDG42631.1 Copper transport outer membrane protein, MctB [Lentzea fradiae]